MNKEEILKELKRIRKEANSDLKRKPEYKNYEVKNVKYYGQVELIKKESAEKVSFDLHVIEVGEKEGEVELRYYLNGEEVDFAELLRDYESPTPIRDLIDEAEKNKELPEKEQDKSLKLHDLNELEKEEKGKDESAKDKEDDKNNEKVKDLKISNAKGEVDLDQQVNGETLRKILGLGEEFDSIAPVRAETVGASGSAEYCYVAIRNDKTCIVLGEDILQEDRQEGVNPYDKDLKVNSNGDITKESSIAGFKIANRPNFFLSVGFDENSSTRSTVITDVSSREGRVGEVGQELEKDGDGWQDHDARNELREENGIGGADNIKEKQEQHEKINCENDRIENIDDNENNNLHEHIINASTEVPGKNGITFEQWADELNAGTEEIIARFEKEMQENNAEDAVKIIDSDYDRLPGHNR